MHIRYNETLLRYEYSTTDTDSGPWVLLPLTNNIGGALTDVAYTNIQNIFTQNQDINKVSPVFTFYDSSQGADARRFRIVNESQKLYLQAVNDAVSASLGYITISRTGKLVVSDSISCAAEIFPGRVDIAPVVQGSWYIGSHASFGIYTNTGLYTAGDMWAGNGGIVFPSTAVAHASPNTLDDYEEGTWTPIFTTISGGTPGYTNQFASYIKIGRNVYVSGRITLNSKGSLVEAQVTINGFPFLAQASNFHGITVPYFQGMATGTTWMCAMAYPSSDYAYIHFTSGAVVGVTGIKTSNVATNLDLIFSGSYMSVS